MDSSKQSAAIKPEGRASPRVTLVAIISALRRSMLQDWQDSEGYVDAVVEISPSPRGHTAPSNVHKGHKVRRPLPRRPRVSYREARNSGPLSPLLREAANSGALSPLLREARGSSPLSPLLREARNSGALSPLPREARNSSPSSPLLRAVETPPLRIRSLNPTTSTLETVNWLIGSPPSAFPADVTRDCKPDGSLFIARLTRQAIDFVEWEIDKFCFNNRKPYHGIHWPWYFDYCMAVKVARRWTFVALEVVGFTYELQVIYFLAEWLGGAEYSMLKDLVTMDVSALCLPIFESMSSIM